MAKKIIYDLPTMILAANKIIAKFKMQQTRSMSAEKFRHNNEMIHIWESIWLHLTEYEKIKAKQAK